LGEDEEMLTERREKPRETAIEAMNSEISADSSLMVSLQFLMPVN